VDRLDRLRAAYQQAHQLGEDLLRVLRGAPGDAAFERISQIVSERDRAVSVAVELFRPGDEVALASELQALVQQQKALEAEMQRLLEALQRSFREADRIKATVQSARRLMDSSRRGRLVNKLL